MTREQAEDLRARARELVWSYPSSSGNPIAGDRYGDLVAGRQAFADAGRCFVDQGKPDAAVEIAANAWRLWIKARDVAGGRAFLAEVLDRGPATPSRERALALYGDGLLAFWAGRVDDSRARSEASLAVAEQVNDTEALALACTGLSRAALEEGDGAKAREEAARAVELSRGLGEAMGQAPLHLLAQACRLGEDYDTAAALFTESVALNRRIGDAGMVMVDLHNLGWVEIHRGDVDAAERCFEECAPDDPDPYVQALTEMNRAAVAYGRGHLDEARSLLASAGALFKASGMEPSSDERRDLEWLRLRLAQ